MAEVATATISTLGDTTSSKKRHLDSTHAEKSQRKHKRSKSSALLAADLATETTERDSTPKQKKKSHKSSKAKDSHTEQEPAPDKTGEDGGNTEENRPKKKKSESKKDRKEKKKKSKKSRESLEQVFDDDDDDDDRDDEHGNNNNDNDDDIAEQSGVVVLKSSRSKILPGQSKPSEHQYPFYTQTVSQYLPLHPLGISEPTQGYVNQHLEPLLNHYVPSFGGVLLSYRDPRIGEAPGKGSLTQESGAEDIALLESVNEYAVSFGWLTVEIDIFRPSRGAWLEGLVNIQSGGHVGVVCWGKFNASIESERLPRDWTWVDQHAGKGEEVAEPDTTSPSESAQDDTEADQTEVHSTGYWVNGEGSKVTGETPMSFRIKNYEVGTSGDYGYLSIEGTMLTEEEEAEKARQEREVQKRKLSRGVAPHRNRRPLIELGMTKFVDKDEREPESQRTDA
ncbi:hypothetical protein F5Y03DRAFT_318542 [Xylaria venustula]|nr:hypothetical protein F5Y03DRAFT_318542 [Xylaria venustula]